MNLKKSFRILILKNFIRNWYLKLNTMLNIIITHIIIIYINSKNEKKFKYLLSYYFSIYVCNFFLNNSKSIHKIIIYIYIYIYIYI